MLSAARIELLEPKPQKPSYRHLLHVGVGVLQNRLNRVANTGRAWAVGDTTLDVESGTEDYPVNSVGSGKVLDVTTYDADSTDWKERQVAFHDLSDLADDGIDAGYDSVQRIAFYRKGGAGQLWARVRPIPSASATYRLSYSIGAWAQSASLANSPLLEQFHFLFTAEIALAALPAAEWWTDEAENRLRRAELGSSLRERIRDYDKEFRIHIASLNTPRNTIRAEAFPIDG